MKLTRIIAICVIAGSLGIHAVNAKTLRNSGEPAEFPPGSYKGKQYVDSNGCVFIRAGIDGNVTWVPRVSRDRKVICGFKPSVTAAAGTAPVNNNPKVVEITLPPVAAKPAPVRSVVRSAPVRKTVKPRVIARSRYAPVMVAPAPAPQAAAVRTSTYQIPAERTRIVGPVDNCDGISDLSSQYMRHPGFSVRCGPQGVSPVANLYKGGRFRTAEAPLLNAGTMNLPGQDRRAVGGSYRAGYRETVTAGTVGPNVRVVRRHIAEERDRNRIAATIPKGYRPVWNDDRLNQKRTNGTFAGKAQMDLVWSKSVPRRLIDRATGQDVTGLYPRLVYPNTNVAIVSRAATAVPVISSRNTPATRHLQRDTIRASVQVGAYRDAATAQRIARKVRGFGLPVRIGIQTSNGQQLRLVVAGPFRSQSQLNAALGKVQRGGYRGAFIRK